MSDALRKLGRLYDLPSRSTRALGYAAAVAPMKLNRRSS